MSKHGTRKSRADNAKMSWRGKASRASGDLWDARDRIAELEDALREAWPYVPEHHGPVQHKIKRALRAE